MTDVHPSVVSVVFKRISGNIQDLNIMGRDEGKSSANRRKCMDSCDSNCLLEWIGTFTN